MPKATKLTSTQILCLRNIRDYGFHAATGFHGASERGGAYHSVTSLRRRGLIEGPHRGENLTEEGVKVLQEIEDRAARVRNEWLTKRVRRALNDAGLTEATGESAWGFDAEPGTTRGVVHLRYIRDPHVGLKQGTVQFGNDEISRYVRALQSNGFKTSRVNGVKEVDKLLVIPLPLSLPLK
jgi:hypothetical protein